MNQDATELASNASQRKAYLAVGLIVLVALVAIRLPVRTFRDLARGTARHATTDHPRLLDLERQLPARPAEFEVSAPVGRTMAMSLLALLLPCCAAHEVVRAGMRSIAQTRAQRAFQVALASGAGLGLSSCTYFLWLVAFGKPTATFFIVDALIWCAMIGIAYRVRVAGAGTDEKSVGPIPARRDPGERNDRAALGDRHFALPACRVLHRAVVWSFASIVLVALAGLAGETLTAPDGGWDARAIWNLRARLLARSGDDWRQAFATTFDHTDYPLLVPASLARWWTFLGNDPAWPGACVGIAFTLATATVVMTSLGTRRGGNLGLLAGTVLLGTVRFLRCGAAQYADVPLAFCFVGAVALLIQCDEEPTRSAGGKSRGPLLLAGLFAGLAAWTKNEGLLFLAVTLCVRATIVWKDRGKWQAIRECGCVLAGAAPLLLILLIFKFQVPAANDLIASQGLRQITQRLLDPVRHWTIGRGAVAGFVQVTQAYVIVIPLSFLLLRRSHPTMDNARHERFAVPVIGLMLAGYYAAYLTTPYELNWHLATSVDRLLVQLWPLTVLVAFWQLRAPEAAWSADTAEAPFAHRTGSIFLRRVDFDPSVIKPVRETAGSRK